MPAPQCTVGFAATNAGQSSRGDERLLAVHGRARSNECWPEGSNATNACPTLHGRVRSNECWPEGSKATNASPTVHGRVRSNECWPEGSKATDAAPQCTVGFAATNAGPRGRCDVWWGSDRGVVLWQSRNMITGSARSERATGEGSVGRENRANHCRDLFHPGGPGGPEGDGAAGSGESLEEKRGSWSGLPSFIFPPEKLRIRHCAAH